LLTPWFVHACNNLRSRTDGDTGQGRIGKGDVVNVLPEGDGRLVLVRMERPKPKPRNKVRIIRRKGKHSLLSIGRPVSREEIFKALEQFPP